MNTAIASRELNLAAMAQVQAWAARSPQRLMQEVTEMQEHFPHFEPAVYYQNGILTCECDSPLTFRGARAGGPRCTGCGGTRSIEPRMATQLAWAGYLPTLLPSRVAYTIAGRLHPSHRLISVAGKQWLLAPILFRYPDEWPNAVPTVQYDKHLLPMLGLSIGANIHTIGDNVLCLFSGRWRAMSARAVLQQRVVNHFAALIRIADGTNANDAFIGPAHRHDYDDYHDWHDR